MSQFVPITEFSGENIDNNITNRIDIYQNILPTETVYFNGIKVEFSRGIDLEITTEKPLEESIYIAAFIINFYTSGKFKYMRMRAMTILKQLLKMNQDLHIYGTINTIEFSFTGSGRIKFKGEIYLYNSPIKYYTIKSEKSKLFLNGLSMGDHSYIPTDIHTGKINNIFMLSNINFEYFIAAINEIYTFDKLKICDLSNNGKPCYFSTTNSQITITNYDNTIIIFNQLISIIYETNITLSKNIIRCAMYAIGAGQYEPKLNIRIHYDYDINKFCFYIDYTYIEKYYSTNVIEYKQRRFYNILKQI